MGFNRKKVNTTAANSWLAVNGVNICLAKAPNGTIWALYADTASGASKDLLVAYSSDGGLTWTEEVALADGRVSNDYLGRSLALMVDSSSVPHIIFIGMNAADLREGRIRYLNRTGGSWSAVETVDDADANTDIYQMTACIDSTNAIHIIATGTFGATGGLHYWTGTTGAWGAPESIDASAAAGGGSCITVTSANLPVVIYDDAGGIKYNDRTGGVWTNEATISVTSENAYGNNIVVDSANNIHVVYMAEITSYAGIKYRKRTSGVWGTVQTVISSATEDYGLPLLGIDSSDKVYVVYQYAANTSSAETVWYKQIVSEVVGAEQVLDSLATQPDGRPSPFAYLWHRFPTSGILSTQQSPCCLVLDENGANADVYLLSGIGGTPGTMRVIGSNTHVIDHFGIDQTLTNT